MHGGPGRSDMSLLPRLSALLGAELESLIIGDMAPKDANGGNMTECRRGGNIASFSLTLRCVYCGGAAALIQLYREVKKAWIAKRQENLSEGCVRKRATLRRVLRTGCMSAIRRYRSGSVEFPKVKETDIPTTKTHAYKSFC